MKIDGQFIRGLNDHPLDAAAVRCFVDVAHVPRTQPAHDLPGPEPFVLRAFAPNSATLSIKEWRLRARSESRPSPLRERRCKC